MKKMESPFTVVVKMNAAEATLAFDEAMLYENVEKIYKGQANDTLSPVELWKDLLIMRNKMSKSPKITNQFKYYNYDIYEAIDGRKTEVLMKSKYSAGIKTIIYKLDFEEGGWKINAIEYQNQ